MWDAAGQDGSTLVLDWLCDVSAEFSSTLVQWRIGVRPRGGGHQDSDAILLSQKTKKRIRGSIIILERAYGQEDMGTNGLPLLHEKIAESMWRAMGWVFDRKDNTVTNFRKLVF